MQKRVTVDDVMSLNPCKRYPRWRVEKLFAGRESLGWREILTLGLPARDMLWLFLRQEFLPSRRLYLLACEFAEQVLHLTKERSRNVAEKAIRVKRLWVDGKAADDELNEAIKNAQELNDEYDPALSSVILAAKAKRGRVAWRAAWDAAETIARAPAWTVSPLIAEIPSQLDLVVAALEEEG